MRKVVLTTSATLLIAAVSAAAGYWLGNGGTGAVISAAAQAQEKPGSKTTGRVGRPADRPENAIVKQAREWGVTTCSQQVTNISDFLTAGSVYSSNTTSGREKPDRQIFSAAIAARFPESGIMSWSNMTVAPIDDSCNVTYQTVTYFGGNCSTVRNEHFANFTNRIEFGDLVELYSNEGGEATLYLMQTTTEGCIAIKNQTLY